MSAAIEPDLGRWLAGTLSTRGRGGDARVFTSIVRRLWTERAAGNVCLPLDDQAGREVDGDALPDLPTCVAALRASGACGDAHDDSPVLPLVLDGRQRLYLRRDFAAERTIVACVRSRIGGPALLDAAALRAHLTALGPLTGITGSQAVAVAAAARSPFAVITGGPGTGKTTTVAALLAVLLREDPHMRVALCAPTGKAAARLHEALRQRAAEHAELRQVAERCQPTTMHRLLGYLPNDDRFRADAANPLPHDLVVVDEASMADPVLLATLCAAMRPQARLLLVGDRDQLAAIAAGQVLGDVCRAAASERGCSTELADYVRTATGESIAHRTDAPAIADCVVHLQKNWRFAAQPGIGAFASALARRDANGALAALRAGHDDLLLVRDAKGALARLEATLLAVVRGGEPDAAARLGRLRILTATRHGPGGSLAWNARVEAMLTLHGVRVQDPEHEGRPILVTANDHQNHVFNGDLGVVVRHDGKPVVAFPRGDGTLRLLPLRRLPAHETAWAMTVHKAQGSEYDEVLLVMPDQAGPSWQAPLLYTGITRARRRALLLADESLLTPALSHWPARSSGLADALHA